MRCGLGRIPSEDPKDLNYPLKAALPKKLPKEKIKYWNANGWWGDQGDTSQCVGYSWAHFIEDGPVMHRKAGPEVQPEKIYRRAQEVDEWEGSDYDGTSVRAGAKALQELGYIGEYRWAFDLDTMINAVLTTSPVVVGTDWFTDMFYPNKEGIIKIGGRIEGGHAYVCNGINVNKGMFRIKNSWGRAWSKNGFAYISFEDMEKLIRYGGEICCALEQPILGVK